MHHHSINHKILYYLEQIVQSQPSPCLEVLSVIGTLLLSLVVIGITIYFNRKNIELQKLIHKQSAELALREKYLEIYSVFEKASLCLNYDNVVIHLPSNLCIEYTMKYTYRIIEQRANINLVADQALLIFKEDEVLKDILKTIAEEFEAFSTEAIKVFYTELALIKNKTEKIKENFPQYFSDGQSSFEYNLLDKDEKEYVTNLFESDEIKNLEAKIANFKKLFEYEQFDKHFEKYFDLKIK